MGFTTRSDIGDARTETCDSLPPLSAAWPDSQLSYRSFGGAAQNEDEEGAREGDEGLFAVCLLVSCSFPYRPPSTRSRP